MPTEIDELMDLDPLELTSENVDQIVQYHRNQRASWDQAASKKKAVPKSEAGAALLDLVKGMTTKAAPAEIVSQPKPSSGLRRV